jgi:CheY-like chemotaxis protein
VASAHTIMLVEDDRDIRDSLADVLTFRGYRVVPAADGLAAWERLRSGLRPAVIVLDMMMPRLDGWSFLELVATVGELAVIPVVVVSAMPVRLDELPVRPVAGLSKPFRVDHLLALLRRTCTGQSGDQSARP